jgi:hypothetical protein
MRGPAAALVLDHAKGNKRAACKVLDISYHAAGVLRHRIEDGLIMLDDQR